MSRPRFLFMSSSRCLVSSRVFLLISMRFCCHTHEAWPQTSGEQTKAVYKAAQAKVPASPCTE